jgi:hypothetical protein
MTRLEPLKGVYEILFLCLVQIKKSPQKSQDVEAKSIQIQKNGVI